MNGAFYIGATGIEAQQRALDVTANNIANVNTPGFKRAAVRFSELVGPSAPDSLAPTAGPALAGVAVEDGARVFGQGQLRQTGKPLDLAIDGAGFLELLGPGGQTLLTRGGALKINSDGYLAAENGLPLKAMIAVPEGASGLQIARDGKVTVDGANGARTEIGQIELVQPKDLAALSSAGQGLYQVDADAELTSAAPGSTGAGALVSGSLEDSNVQLADEMIGLLVLQRAYAASAQVVQAGDQLMSIANNLRR